MTINITPDRIIQEIQKEFNEEFPFLKLEFFKKGIRYKSAGKRTPSLSKELKLGNINMFQFKETLKISGSMSVKELENIFDKLFGLSVLVYRKSGNLWLETTMTDNWTLEQQNENGRQISG